MELPSFQGKLNKALEGAKRVLDEPKAVRKFSSYRERFIGVERFHDAFVLAVKDSLERAGVKDGKIARFESSQKSSLEKTEKREEKTPVIRHTTYNEQLTKKEYTVTTKTYYFTRVEFEWSFGAFSSKSSYIVETNYQHYQAYYERYRNPDPVDLNLMWLFAQKKFNIETTGKTPCHTEEVKEALEFAKQLENFCAHVLENFRSIDNYGHFDPG